MPSTIRVLYLSLLILFASFLAACQGEKMQEEIGVAQEDGTPVETLFSLLPPEKTNITFSNTIQENPYGNILMYQYFYNGGGVAVGDINNDGLQDIYFSGNMVANRLYLNKGNMQFEDITTKAGMAGRATNWKTGVTMADVNGDGLLDIYLCYSGNMPPEARANQLFINQGPDSGGSPKFLDQAKEYGLADTSFSTGATFFDFDRDGDLDMFLLNHNPTVFKNLDEISIREIQKKVEPEMRVKLFRNDDGKFQEVTDRAGFAGSAFTYGLGAGIADINNDGWPDIYISNDYSAPDHLYINNGNGTFTDRINESIGHISLYSMGNDIADINNDGLLDVYTLDMLPEDNRRQKLLFAPDNYEYYDQFVRVGFRPQYMRNMLQVNNGDGTFSEVGQLAGISNTDWSWAPLLADYDNDGWKDLFVTNGFLRDFTNLDFIRYRSSYVRNVGGSPNQKGILELVNRIPSSNVTNYIYRNNGDLTFSDKGAAWGLGLPSNSNGAAYADLDNDGDLDLVVSNLNQPAFLYQNEASGQLGHRYLQLKLLGSGKNTAGIGAKVTLYRGGKRQHQEQMPARGYQSSVWPVLHFGLGQENTIDSLRVVWPSGRQQVLTEVKANQVLTLREEEATSTYHYPKASAAPALQEVRSPVSFAHQRSAVNDFKRQPLLVNPLSSSGPCMVKGDVDGDGLEDIYVGGAAGQAGALYIQQKGGRFTARATPAFEADRMSHDADAVFFDANQDGKLDLYVGSGGYHHFAPQDALLQDRLYLNDGKGNFTKAADALPAMLTSTGSARAADVNGDGHMDLFVGGRVVPGRYPETPRSYVLLNDGKGRFRDATASVAPELQQLGMVTDAAWHDLDGDQRPELVVVGEWMPITVFRVSSGRLAEATGSYFSKEYRGWWNRLVVEDFNQDGRPDLLVGNLGLNSQVRAGEGQPAELYYKDFDDNGSVDPMLTFYIQGQSYPYVTRDELLDQISLMRTRFTDYNSYADATLQDIFTAEELSGVQQLSANYLKNAYFEGGAGGKFVEKALPMEAQFAPVFAIAPLDYNRDGKLDVLLAGNMHQARLRFGRYDASHGVLLEGDGQGGFIYVPQRRSGLQVRGDVRSLLEENGTLLFGLNQQPIKAYKIK